MINIFLEYKNYSINVEFLWKERAAIFRLFMKKEKTLRRQKAYEETTNGGGEMKMEVSTTSEILWYESILAAISNAPLGKRGCIYFNE